MRKEHRWYWIALSPNDLGIDKKVGWMWMELGTMAIGKETVGKGIYYYSVLFVELHLQYYNSVWSAPSNTALETVR